MALQYSIAVRNAQLDQVEVVTGASALLQIRTLAPPADCAAADTGAVLVTMNLPADWMNAAAAGTKAKSATAWQDAAADATGTAAHFRIKDTAGTTTHIQGTVTLVAGGGDMTLDNTSIVSGQSVTINSFTLTAANA